MPPNPSGSQSPFTALPYELHIHLSHFLPQPTLHALLRTSRLLYTLYNPINLRRLKHILSRPHLPIPDSKANPQALDEANHQSTEYHKTMHGLINDAPAEKLLQLLTLFPPPTSLTTRETHSLTFALRLCLLRGTHLATLSPTPPFSTIVTTPTTPKHTLFTKLHHLSTALGPKKLTRACQPLWDVSLLHTSTTFALIDHLIRSTLHTPAHFQTRFARSLLHTCFTARNIPSARYLLAHGVDPNCRQPYRSLAAPRRMPREARKVEVLRLVDLVFTRFGESGFGVFEGVDWGRVVRVPEGEVPEGGFLLRWEDLEREVELVALVLEFGGEVEFEKLEERLERWRVTAGPGGRR